MDIQNIYLEENWLEKLSQQFNADYMKNLRTFLREEQAKGQIIYPENHNVFAALNLTPYKNVRVVILGQDPYHGENQAHGLSFSVPKSERIPPSLRNIYKELEEDLGVKAPTHGNLETWAKQGVLLLNSVLTVRAHEAASHQGKGWEKFTDEIIRELNHKNEPIVFMLWGSYAQKKGAFIDRNKHLVLESAHPSPLSAYRGFFGCGHFSKANDFLKKNNLQEIRWDIT